MTPASTSTDNATGQPVLLGTSWKMNKTLGEALDFVESLLEAGVPSTVDAFILPPHTALATLRARLPRDSGMRVGAQNAHWADEGAFTGEVSMRMIRDAGASMVEIGHSERRTLFAETDDDVRRKVGAALEHDLVPLVCVGESAADRDAGAAESFVVAQVRAALASVAGADSRTILIAYEPVWSIGAGGRAAAPAEVAPVIGAIRRAAAEILIGPPVRVLYGGSVDEDNALSLLEGTGVDGLFVGRAALSSSRFQRLMALCAEWSTPDPQLPTQIDREVHHAACR